MQPAEYQILIKRADQGHELTNGCCKKIIPYLETLDIKERFGIDKWAILVNSLNQEQLEELWLSYHQGSL